VGSSTRWRPQSVVSARITPLRLECFEQLPKHARRCVFWEVDPTALGCDDRLADPEFEKEAWLSMVMLEWGACGQIAVPVAAGAPDDEGAASNQAEAPCVGYALYAPPGAVPTHKVTALRTLAFPGPSIKTPPLEALPLGARVAVARIENRMAVTPSGGYLPAAHLAPLDKNESDFVAVAERFLGTPYLWGGKTALGLDCSGLVQVALTACGVACPRDSDMQEAALGTAVPVDPSALSRGDLVFWKGHVAIVRDRSNLLHANAYHMAVAIEPIADAVVRIRNAGSEITSIRRIVSS